MYLEGLYIKETNLKGGYGQRLNNKVVKIAKETGLKRMDWQGLAWNESAIAFHQKKQRNFRS
ncbi:MAG: GNAT family N-acetyltransferase [Crocinitomicaceae bacterium]|nr:GNAT family N-acetyltransferase [Crocinitomicaceae bacterium]